MDRSCVLAEPRLQGAVAFCFQAASANAGSLYGASDDHLRAPVADNRFLRARLGHTTQVSELVYFFFLAPKPVFTQARFLSLSITFSSSCMPRRPSAKVGYSMGRLGSATRDQKRLKSCLCESG